MSSEFTVTYTRVHSHSVLGQILIDPQMAEDEIHLYHVKGDEVVLDKVVNIGKDSDPVPEGKDRHNHPPDPDR